jgi:hypothetical protein
MNDILKRIKECDTVEGLKNIYIDDTKDYEDATKRLDEIEGQFKELQLEKRELQTKFYSGIDIDGMIKHRIGEIILNAGKGADEKTD